MGNFFLQKFDKKLKLFEIQRITNKLVNFTDMNKLQEFLSSFRPAKREQDKYKKRAKDKGMLNFEEFLSLQESMKDSPQELLDLSKDLKITLSLQTNDFTVEEKSQLKRDNGVVTLKNKLIFNSSNLNGFAIDPKSLLENKYTQEIGKVNVDHNQNLTAVIGEFYSYKADGDKLYADIDVDTNHPEFASQLYLIETQDLTLGWSIEARLTGVSGFYDFMSGEGNMVYEYALTGLGATFTPAVPTTMMMDEEKSESLSTADNSNLESETTNNTIQLSMTEEQITQLKADLESQTSLANSLEEEKITLSTTITSLEADNVELTVKVSDFETKLAESELKLTETTELSTAMESAITALEEANKVLSKKLNTPQTIF
jgi:hypothetical protein